MEHWVQTWGMAHAGLSLMAYSPRRTLRLVVGSAISGEAIRVRLSNRFGRNLVTISQMSAAVCLPDGTRTGLPVRLTVNGRSSLSIAEGDTVTTDAAQLHVPAGGCFCVSVYVSAGTLYSGNMVDNALLLCQRGDCAADVSLSYQKRPRDLVIRAAGAGMGLYFPRPIPLFETVELLSGEAASAIVCLGDSLTQQGRWTGPLEQALRERYPGRYALINRGITGNRLLRNARPNHTFRDLFGQSALERVAWDVLAFGAVSHVIVNLGTNDLAQPGTSDAPASDRASAAEIADGLGRLASMLRQAGIATMVCTCIPFGDAKEYTPRKRGPAGGDKPPDPHRPWL